MDSGDWIVIVLMVVLVIILFTLEVETDPLSLLGVDLTPNSLGR